MFWNILGHTTKPWLQCEKFLPLFGSFIFGFENWMDCYFCANKIRTKTTEKIIVICNKSLENHTIACGIQNWFKLFFFQIVCGDEKGIRKCKYYCVHILARESCAIHYRLSEKRTMYVKMEEKPLIRNFFFADCFVDWQPL